MSFSPRLTKPEKGNPYYNTIGNGGYSTAIKGKPTDAGCDVLSNCVGYAFGRANEIMQSRGMSYLAPVNAENFWQYRGNLAVGQLPKVGAVMVWQKGATMSNDDGAGHVAVVEIVHDNYTVTTSESAYGGTAFYTQKRYHNGGNWGMNAPYKFLGFIYLPIEGEKKVENAPQKTAKNVADLPTLAIGTTSDAVKAMQILLNGNDCDCGKADRVFGSGTKAALIQYQKSHGLDADGVCGGKTWASLLGL